MAEVRWIKLSVDMFDNRKIKHLRSLPNGDSIVLIWVMLLTMAGRCNAGGYIFLTESIRYTPAMLANELNFPQSTVEMALNALQKLDMITIDDDSSIFITKWADHQNLDGMERIREQARIRKQNQRERQKLMSRDSNVTVTQCHATDIERDKERELEKDRECVKEEAHTLEAVRQIAESVGKGSDAQVMYLTFCKHGWPNDLKQAVNDWLMTKRTTTTAQNYNQREYTAEEYASFDFDVMGAIKEG